MRNNYTIAVCVLLSVACVPAGELTFGDGAVQDSVSQPIIGGVRHEDSAQVVGLLTQSGSLLCTGTLIAPEIVLTAAHCVRFDAISRVYFGSDATRMDGVERGVQRTIAHEGFDTVDIKHDIALVVLSDPAPANITPSQLATEPPVVGESVRAAGYGYTLVEQKGEYGLKYDRTVPVTEVREQDFRYGVATCNGDSGGPAFRIENGNEVIAGVTSWGDETCAEFGVNMRVDIHRPWVAERLAELGPPSCEGDARCAVGCDVVDPDCPCAADGICGPSCPSGDVDCPATCGADGACDLTCPVRDPDCALIDIGASCESAAQCASSVCVETCLRSCAANVLGICEAGSECREVAPSAHACFPETDSGGGCGCRVAPAKTPQLPWAMALLLGVVAWFSRRGHLRRAR